MSALFSGRLKLMILSLSLLVVAGGCGKVASSPTVQVGVPGELSRVQEMIDSGSAKKAAKIASKWQKDNPVSEYYELAIKLEADAHYESREYYKSYLAYEKLLNEYSSTTYFSYAIERKIDIAQRFLAGQKRSFLGVFRVSARLEALKILDDIDARWPGSQAGAQAVMTRADYYFDKGKYFEAELEYHRILTSYSRSSHYPRAMFLEAESKLRQYEGIYYDSICLEEAVILFGQYKLRFPEEALLNGVDEKLSWITNEQLKKEYEIADYYNRTGRIPQAVLYWESVIELAPESEYAQKAVEMIQNLQKQS